LQQAKDLNLSLVIKINIDKIANKYYTQNFSFSKRKKIKKHLHPGKKKALNKEKQSRMK
jgi:hypothetical protein